jgi:hypothetical protein
MLYAGNYQWTDTPLYNNNTRLFPSYQPRSSILHPESSDLRPTRRLPHGIFSSSGLFLIDNDKHRKQASVQESIVLLKDGENPQIALASA